MTARDISIRVYHQIESEGLLSRMRLKVLKALVDITPATASQVFEGLKSHSNTQGANVRARLGELRDLGCVEELGIVECPITGRHVLLWGVTNRLPVKTKNLAILKLTKAGNLEVKIKRLEQENKALKEEIKRQKRSSKGKSKNDFQILSQLKLF